jgi:O-antigen/teichoic acid export membrane protein
LLWYLVGAIVIVLFPMVSELWARREKKLLGGVLHFLTKFSFMLIIPAALLFITFPEIAIRLLFGANYLAGAMVLQILSVVAIVYTLYKILGCAISGIGKPIVVTKVFAVMACLNLVGNLLLIPTYGIEGAAVATLSAHLLGLALLFYYTRKFIRFTVPVMPLLKTLVGGTLTLFLIFGLKSIIVLPPWPEAFAVLIPGLSFYGIWLLTTKAITKDDLRLISRIVPMPRWLARLAGRFIGK